MVNIYINESNVIVLYFFKNKVDKQKIIYDTTYSCHLHFISITWVIVSHRQPFLLICFLLLPKNKIIYVVLEWCLITFTVSENKNVAYLGNSPLFKHVYLSGMYERYLIWHLLIFSWFRISCFIFSNDTCFLILTSRRPFTRKQPSLTAIPRFFLLSLLKMLNDGRKDTGHYTQFWEVPFLSFSRMPNGLFDTGRKRWKGLTNIPC